MVRKKFVVITYDIADDRRRGQIAELLDLYGERVNLSVFECMVSEAKFRKLREKLLPLVSPDEDKLLIYTVCSACYPKIEQLGNTKKQYKTCAVY